MKFSSVDFLMGNKWRRSGAKLYSSSTIFTFVPFPASPLWMLTYFRDMIDLKFRQHLLLHIWKIIRHYCIAEKSWCSPFKIKCHSGLKKSHFTTIFGGKIQIGIFINKILKNQVNLTSYFYISIWLKKYVKLQHS